jgi:hypothetical protein
MPLKSTVIHNPNRTAADDQLTLIRLCEIYREFHEREAKRKAAEDAEIQKNA